MKAETKEDSLSFVCFDMMQIMHEYAINHVHKVILCLSLPKSFQTTLILELLSRNISEDVLAFTVLDLSAVVKGAL